MLTIPYDFLIGFLSDFMIRVMTVQDTYDFHAHILNTFISEVELVSSRQPVRSLHSERERRRWRGKLNI